MKLYRGWPCTVLFVLGCCCMLAIVPLSYSHAESTEGAAPTPGAPQAESTGVPPAGEQANAEVMPTAPSPSPQELTKARNQEVLQALNSPEFTYNPARMTDPFVSFITPKQSSVPEFRVGEEDEMLPPERRRPLTPLEKMTSSEIEAGFKAVLWGTMGRRALIEDKSGKGYLVDVGTAIGENNGILTQIFEDQLVIQQEIWDKKEKRMIPQNISIKLKKVGQS